MSSLISRYYESFGAPKGSPARKKVADIIKAKRVLQKKGEGPNVRKALMEHVGSRMAHRRKVAAKRAALEKRSKATRLAKTQHKITIGSQLNHKQIKKAGQKTQSFAAGAGIRRNKRTSGSSALHNFTHYA